MGECAGPLAMTVYFGMIIHTIVLHRAQPSVIIKASLIPLGVIPIGWLMDMIAGPYKEPLLGERISWQSILFFGMCVLIIAADRDAAKKKALVINPTVVPYSPLTPTISPSTRASIPGNIQSRLKAAMDNLELGHFGVGVQAAGTAVEVALKQRFNISGDNAESITIGELFRQARDVGYLTRTEVAQFDTWWKYRNDSTHWAKDPEGDDAWAMVGASEALVRKAYGMEN